MVKRKKESDTTLMVILNICMVASLVMYFLASGLNAISSFHYLVGSHEADVEMAFDIVKNMFMAETSIVALYFTAMSIIDYILYKFNKFKPLVIFTILEFAIVIYVIVVYGGVVSTLTSLDAVRLSMAIIMPVIVFLYSAILCLFTPEKKKLFGRK